MKKDGISSLKIAATYIGTIVGAGFATGQEVLQFFLKYGLWGLAGLLIATGLFIFIGFLIMDIGKRLDARSYLEIIRFTGGRFIGALIDLLITFFLFGGLSAMLAGTGALFEQHFGLPGLIGNLIMAGITVITVMTGIKGVINSISVVVPFLLVSVIGISIISITNTPPVLSSSAADLGEGGVVHNWLIAAILYVSYNTVLSVAVLGPLGARAKSRRSLGRGALLGGLGLGIASFMILLALSGRQSEISKLEVPMIYIAGNVSSTVQLIFAIVLIAEIYTTAVGSLYGFVSRFMSAKKPLLSESVLVISSAVTALLASQLGFSNLVKYLYPLVGYGGLIFLVSLLYSELKRRPLRRVSSKLKNNGVLSTK